MYNQAQHTFCHPQLHNHLLENFNIFRGAPRVDLLGSLLWLLSRCR
eukprot:SAG11_NODE_8432_length_1016_cov_1.055616_1_plen_45_part_10